MTTINTDALEQTVQLFQMALNFPDRQATCIERNDLVVEARPTGLVFANDLWLKVAKAIPRDINGQCAKVAFQGFPALVPFGYLPLRVLPVALLTGPCLAWPRCSVISASKARSTRALVSCFSKPFTHSRSSGF